MSACLICFAPLAGKTGWLSFVRGGTGHVICLECEEKFHSISGTLCTCCGREMKTEGLCPDCMRWKTHPLGSALTQNRAVYLYNDWMKEVLARFKFRGDAALVDAFREPLHSCFRQHFSACTHVMPVPLSTERLHERGFNQAELLAAVLPLQMITDAVARVHTEKQSKKSRAERLQGESPFLLSGKAEWQGRHILLVDDVYTTGTTLRQMAALVMQGGAASVCSLTLCRS